MKEIAQLILKLRMSLSVLCITNEPKSSYVAHVFSEGELGIFDRHDSYVLAITTEHYDIKALKFKKPDYSLIESLYTKLGLNSDYGWSIKSRGQFTLILRIHHARSFSMSDAKFKKPIAEAVFTSSQVGTFSVVTIVDESGKSLLSKKPSLDEPPFEIEYKQFLQAIKEFIDVDKLIEEEEENEIKTLSKEIKDHIETPLIPLRVYSKLPQFFKRYTDQYNLVREKDVALLSSIVVMSSIIPNIVSRHRSKKIWAHLYLVVTAPPASGKGVIADTAAIIGEIEKEFREIFDLEFKQYKADLAKFKNGEIDEEPAPPALRTIQLPTDTSFIALFEQLVTEIDGFVNAGKQEWGNYSVLNRKATHHEPHLLDRKGFKKPLFVQSPRIAMVLGGTTGQFFSLFRSTEDGLFSRFLIYCYQLKRINLLNPFTYDNSDFFDTIIEESASLAKRLYSQLSKLEKEIEFQWTSQQSEKLYKHFNKMLESVHELYGESSNSVILRHMLAATRLGIVLTTVQAFEEGTLFSNSTLTANDDTVEVVIDIIQTCSQHSLLMMANIDANSKNKPMDMKSHNTLRFFNALPEGRSFKTKDAIKIGLSIRISERSVGDYLASLCKSKHLEQTGYGEYRRLK
jgi:hypothetical protein